MAELKKLEDWTPEDHRRFIRRDGSGGRPPRVDDPDRVPTDEELVAAGLAKPPSPPLVPAKPGPSVEEQVKSGAARRELTQFEKELNYALQAHVDRINGVPRHEYIRRLRVSIEQLRAALPEDEGEKPETPWNERVPQSRKPIPGRANR